MLAASNQPPLRTGALSPLFSNRGAISASATAIRRYQRLSDVAIHESTDPAVVIAEYQLHGEMVQSGEPFSQRFVMVMTVRDGMIVHSRDYANPITGARLLGKLPELLSELGPTPDQ